MKKYKSRKLLNIFSGPKFISFVGLIVIVLLAFPIYKVVNKKYVIDQEIADLEKEIVDLETSNKDLKGFIGYLESDQFLEEQARLKLGLKKPGEEVIVLKNEASSTEMSEEELARQRQENLTNPERWWEYFFNN